MFEGFMFVISNILNIIKLGVDGIYSFLEYCYMEDELELEIDKKLIEEFKYL